MLDVRSVLLSGIALLFPVHAIAQLPPVSTGGFHVSDFNNDRVAVYDAGGGFLHTSTAPGLDGPRGIVFAPNGQVYVASQLGNAIYVFDANEQYVTQFTSAQLSGPTGMAMGPSGELYVSSFSNARICVFDLAGAFQRWFTAPGFNTPNCVTFDSGGFIYSSSAATGLVFKFDPTEQFVTSFGAPPPTILSSPMGIARDACDVLHVAGGASHNIVRFTTDGIFLGVITHPDLTGPQGVAFDDRGHLFSASFYQHNVVEFAPGGTYVQTITAGGLNIPRTIAFVPTSDPAVAPYGCGVNPPGSLVVQSGSPSIGTTFVLGVDNPLGTQSAGAFPILALALAPDAAFPCGTSIPGWGMAAPGSPGELLLNLLPPDPVLFLAGTPWTGPGSPVPFALPVPGNCALVGLALYAQGALLDPGATSGVPLGLTEALVIRIRP